MERSGMRGKPVRGWSGPGFRFRLRATRFGGLAEPAVARGASEGWVAPSGLLDVRGSSKPGDHRGIEQVRPRARRILGHGDQLAEPLALDLRVALLEEMLVADRHRLHLLDR